MAEKVIDLHLLVYIQAWVNRLKVARNTQQFEREGDLIDGLIWRQGHLSMEVLRLRIEHIGLELGL